MPCRCINCTDSTGAGLWTGIYFEFAYCPTKCIPLLICYKHRIFIVRCRELDNNELSGILDDSVGIFTALTSLSQLSLSSNRIKSITKRAFEGLGSLEQLFLLDNNITSVQDNAFSSLKNLQEM